MNTVLAPPGPLATAKNVSARKLSPARMSACGWSSLDMAPPTSLGVVAIGLFSVRKRGSTYDTAGSAPDAASARNLAYGAEIDRYFCPHKPRNGMSPK